jgi:hypothetical protein
MEPRLTPKQAEAFRQRIAPMLGFVHGCRRRLEARGFHPSSKVFQLVNAAYDALHSLHIELHYMACKSGVWRAKEDVPDATATDQSQAAPNQSDS